MVPEKIIWQPSPNFDKREADVPTDMLVLHYTGMETGKAALERLTEATSRVSAHYLVEEDGRIFQMVEEECRAWHAGVASWRGHTDINARSIGIEIVNPGHEFGYRAFPEPQMESVSVLASKIIKRHNIRGYNVVGHSDVAPDRKQDPGELFDWTRLAANGIGVLASLESLNSQSRAILTVGSDGEAVLSLRRALTGIGYDAKETAEYDTGLALIVTAFQRHWRQSKVDGRADAETQSLIYSLNRYVHSLT
jgi:N-acetylmuramoyl-L-alanine amidase